VGIRYAGLVGLAMEFGRYDFQGDESTSATMHMMSFSIWPRRFRGKRCRTSSPSADESCYEILASLLFWQFNR